ncbi:MAG TPA: hypothetical protein EYM37_07610 [Methylophaga aminisulfidivorans]|jgi:ABC-type phosphate transport system substrate-binding protein|uniref:substrate-binding domain-containing protein n=1 Tax=Methylophaga TaxID=40222 RepID=UPI001764F729|nr:MULTISPECIES: substrate-binding domain-containing protein [Methylophaga]HIC47998.1 hypothetical protein [Methylophaga sp.]HIM39797.1 hypothetical protein [Methylophaga aminisulfidivorans]
MTWISIRILITLLFLVSQDLPAQNVIANVQVETKQLSKTTARSIFAMRVHQWSDGTPIKVFVLQDQNPTHNEFCKSILGMFPYQLRRIWDRQVFSGTGAAPVVVNSEQEMLNAVASTEGAIGYISLDNADTHEGIQMIKVDL